MPNKPLTTKMVSEYNRIARRINRLRKKILDEHSKNEGNSPKRPDLIVPRKVKEINDPYALSREQYKRYLDYARGLISDISAKTGKKDLETFYKNAYKNNYLDAILEMINTAYPEVIFQRKVGADQDPTLIEKPSLFGKFSKEQIENYPDIAEYLELYNQIVALPASQFMDMYNKGYIVYLKYIYLEMLGSMKEYSPLLEQKELIKTFNKTIRRRTRVKRSKTKKSYKGATLPKR